MEVADIYRAIRKNRGLKAKEAKDVADFMISTVKSKGSDLKIVDIQFDGQQRSLFSMIDPK